MQIRTSWTVYAFCLLNKDCQQAAHTVSIITLTICFYSIWLPLKYNHAMVLHKRDDFLGMSPLILMATFYVSTACLLYYGSLIRVSGLYLPFILAHTGKILYDCFEIIKALSKTLHYLRLSIAHGSISELIYFPTKLEWNYQSTAYEKFRVVGFVSAEILIRTYAVCIVWRAWYLMQAEREKLQPNTERSDIEDIESGSHLPEDQTTEEQSKEDIKVIDVNTKFIRKDEIERF